MDDDLRMRIRLLEIQVRWLSGVIKHILTAFSEELEDNPMPTEVGDKETEE